MTVRTRSLKVLQVDILKRLRRTNLPPRRYKGLVKCGVQSCGMRNCKDVCSFGSKRRLDRQVSAARKLLKKVGGPYFEVHVGRQSWSQPLGNLSQVSLQAVKQVERNALDRLHMPSIAAVGMIKAAFMPNGPEGSWHIEIHQVIAGADREQIRTAFATRLDNSRNNFFWITEAHDLKAAVRRVLGQEVMLRQQPPDAGAEPISPAKKPRSEYYRWTLRLRNGERVIRYGCDRHFNQIEKVGRTIKLPQPRKRRSATWLEQYQFGSDYWEQRNADEMRLKSAIMSSLPQHRKIW